MSYIKYLLINSACILLLSACSPVRFSLPRSAEPFSGLEGMVIKTMQTGNIPALALAIVKDDKVVYRQLFQKSSSLHSDHNLHLDSPHVLGSLSKGLTAVGVLHLAETGQSDLEDTAGKYLPWLEQSKDPKLADITIRQLLNQTSGLTGKDDRLMLIATGIPELQNLARQVLQLQLASAPGNQFNYSNWNYILLGALIETVSGYTYADFMETRIFPFLGMQNTKARLTEENEEAFRQGHQWWFGFSVPKEDNYRPDILPAGFITSTLPDMEQWLLANLALYRQVPTALLSPTSWKTLHSIPETVSSDYAMGWQQQTTKAGPILAHEGMTSTAFSSVSLHPDSGWAVVLLSPVSALYTPKMAAPLAQNIMHSLLGLPHTKPKISFPLWTFLQYIALLIILLLLYLHVFGLIRWYRSLASARQVKNVLYLFRLFLNVAGDCIFPYIALVFVPRGSGFPFWPALFEWQPDLAALTFVTALCMIVLSIIRLSIGLCFQRRQLD